MGAQLSPRPFCMESCPQRPERKNLIWGNVPTSKTGRLVRHGFVSTVLVLLAMNWSSLIQICIHLARVGAQTYPHGAQLHQMGVQHLLRVFAYHVGPGCVSIAT